MPLSRSSHLDAAAAQVVVMGAASDAYARHLTVALHSTAARIDPGREVLIVIVDGGMSPERLARACACIGAAHPRARVTTISSTHERLAGLPVSGRYPAAIYLPLLALDMLPSGIERVLCLDSDVVVTEDVSPLFDMDMDGCPLWAARDAPIDEHGERLRTDFPDLLGSRKTTYVNTGVMLVDLTSWRSERLGEAVLDVLRRHGDLCVWKNQDAVNVALAGRIGVLPDRWNNRLRGADHVFPALEQGPPRGILHFCGSRKPWRGWCLHDDVYHAALLAARWHDPPARLAYRLNGAFRFSRSLYYHARYRSGYGARLRGVAHGLAARRRIGS